MVGASPKTPTGKLSARLFYRTRPVVHNTIGQDDNNVAREYGRYEYESIATSDGSGWIWGVTSPNALADMILLASSLLRLAHCCCVSSVQPPSSVCPESGARVTLKRIPWGRLCVPLGPSGQGSTIDVESSKIRGWTHVLQFVVLSQIES